MIINRAAKDFISKIFAPDGYIVYIGGTDYRDEIEDIEMLINDYNGYEVEEISNTNGKKKRAAFVLKNKG